MRWARLSMGLRQDCITPGRLVAAPSRRAFVGAAATAEGKLALRKFERMPSDYQGYKLKIPRFARDSAAGSRFAYAR
jgi:hypothetical protein